MSTETIRHVNYATGFVLIDYLKIIREQIIYYLASSHLKSLSARNRITLYFDLIVINQVKNILGSLEFFWIQN